MSGRTVVDRDGQTLMRRAVDLNYLSRKRSRSLRWSALNAAALLVLAYDLSCKCPGHMTPLHYVEMCMAAVACANLLQYALQMLPQVFSSTPILTVTPTQRRLLGLSDSDLDSSFRVVPEGASEMSVSPSSRSSSWQLSMDSVSSLSLSLSPRGKWRDEAPPGPSQSNSSHGSPTAADLFQRTRIPQDEFIADSVSLTDYLRQYEERRSREAGALSPPSCGPAWAAPQPPVYQLAPIEIENKTEDRSVVGGAVGVGATAVAELCHLDPQRLMQYNFNLRLWIQLSILERLVAELAAAEACLVRMGITQRLGELSLERLRKLATSPGAENGPLPALVPFLEPFADQAYVVRRIRELATGGCLSSYRWNGGSVDRAPGSNRPTDAELLLHLFATYLDFQLPPCAAKRPFSSEFLSTSPTPLGNGPCVHLTSRAPAPPHYVLAMRGCALDVGAGRNNLLHVLLLLLAELARNEPPSLKRVHLGPAGLNMLWIIGR